MSTIVNKDEWRMTNSQPNSNAYNICIICEGGEML